jgi:putative membrane-bound dehydrogenase-like protein
MLEVGLSEIERAAMSNRSRVVLLALALLVGSWLDRSYSPPGSDAAEPPSSQPSRLPFSLPPGFSAERIAGPPQVEHPMFACFDDRGRLFVADSLGVNPTGAQLGERPAQVIRLLEDADGDGRFEKSTVFADRLTYPEGIAWYDGAVFTAAPPDLWRLEDTRGAGVADRRRKLVTGFLHTGVADELHGPTLGPDGRLYFGCGRFPHEIRSSGGKVLHKGRAPLILRCRPDGGELEVLSGAQGNPVKAAWTPEGELFYCGTWGTRVETMGKDGRPREDAIIHCVPGGNYPQLDGDFFSPEFPHTPDILPPLAYLGVAAACGMTRQDSDAFGADYQGNLFSALYNMHKVQRHKLTRDGATFQSRNLDFLVSTSAAFHPTDVLPDADGSLLVVDTGSWFSHCPTSKLGDRPVPGSIYRIRKSGAPRPADPRGARLLLDRRSPDELAALLDDPRFAVRERAIARLARHGKEAASSLQKAIKTGKSEQLRRNALWTLARIDGPETRAAVRMALADKSESVRQVAAQVVGLHRDAEALPHLLDLVKNGSPPLRREAAAALGRIRRGAAVASLLEGSKTVGDPVLEHVLIHALIQIGDREATRKGLADASPQVQRAALVALDQMKGSDLSRAQVTPLLASVDPALRRTALQIMTARPGWGRETATLLREWLAAKSIPAESQDSVRGALLAFCSDAAVQKLVADVLERDATPTGTRLLLLETIARAPLERLPASWVKQLGRELRSKDRAILRQTLAILRDRAVSDFDRDLARLARDAKQDDEVRLEALSALAPRLGKVDADVFSFLVRCLDREQPPLVRLASAGVLGIAPLRDTQLKELSAAVSTAGPLEMPHLLTAFGRCKDPAVGRSLAAALLEAPGAQNLSVNAVRQAFAAYPEDVRRSVEPLLERLRVDGARQLARLEELQEVLQGGDVGRGRDVFLGPKATCTACHTVGAEGGQIGPNLSKIGAIRSGRDLLEAIVFPSASFVRGFEPFVVTTKAGKTYSGLLRRETAQAITLIGSDRAEVRIARSEIESLEPGQVSIMPQGFDTQLSRQELADLIAFLRSLK